MRMARPASAQVLAFVARRLGADRSRWSSRPATGAALARLPELVVGGLPDVDARALLDSAQVGRIHDRVRDRIVAETQEKAPAALAPRWGPRTPRRRAGSACLGR